MNELLTLFMAVCFFVAGWNCLKRPEAIQQWILQLQQNESAAKLDRQKEFSICVAVARCAQSVEFSDVAVGILCDK